MANVGRRGACMLRCLEDWGGSQDRRAWGARYAGERGCGGVSTSNLVAIWIHSISAEPPRARTCLISPTTAPSIGCVPTCFTPVALGSPLSFNEAVTRRLYGSHNDPHHTHALSGA